MEKTNEKKVLALSGLGVITLILVVVGATYAYFTAQGGGSVNANVNVQTNTTDNLSFKVGEAINLTANEEDFAQDSGNKLGSTTASATLTANNATNNATRNYYLYLDITSNSFEYTTEAETAELILTITNPEGTEVTELSGYNYVTVGDVKGFDITTANGLITLADNYEIISTGTETQDWNVTITFVNLDSDQNANAGKSFNATLKIQEDLIPTKVADVCSSGDNLASCISEFNTLAGDGADNLYYHDGVGSYINADQEAGDNSYRYSGANPNNYVCFGVEGEDCQNGDNQYRIIGVFDNQVKLIKVTDIGNFAWDSGNSNIWNEITQPDIYDTLNTTYWGTIESEWQELIDQNHKWKVDGILLTEKNNSSKNVYDYEVGINQTGYEETMPIGLMYISDYAFGAASSKWTTALYEKNYGTDNWLYVGLIEWVISRNADSSYYAFYVNYHSDGNIGNNNVTYAAAIRPSFYLKSNVELNNGSGTSSDPFILKTT